ncbi:MAG: twin-arginine translocase subunit TatC [Bradymonadaceae bacterium]
MTDTPPTDPRAAGGGDIEGLDEARMSIMEHLVELRMRLLYSLIWLVTGALVCWFWVEPLFDFLLVPLREGVGQAEGIDSAKMHHKDLAEPIFVFLKTSLLGGVFLASPGILYNVWKFIAPGLYDSERRLAGPFVIAATAFFVLGGAFAYYLALPYAYAVLLDFSRGVSDPTLMMREYFALTTKLLFGFGVVFEMPVISMFLAMLGVITHRTLIRYWRIAMVVSVGLAALFTPPDVITQMMMAGPLLVLYGLSIGVAWIFSSTDE